MRLLPLIALLGCTGKPDPTPPQPDTPTIDTDTALPPLEGVFEQDVLVTLDGQPVEGVLVMQGGTQHHHRTDPDGRATLSLDASVLGGVIVVAAHPDARIRGVDVETLTEQVTIELTRLQRQDNPDYVFQDPGTPERNATTGYCSHCHVRQVEDWVDHPHALSASNPVVHDVYAGTASIDAATCAKRGGTWLDTRAPGGGRHTTCLLGGGTLGDLNPACTEPCETPEATGRCADCHAPGIDGALGGRDLLDATGIAYEHGVHCDVCHKVSGIDLEAPPGVAGRLQILRPSEPSPSPTFEFLPLTFAPLPDVLNPRMGSVHAPYFREAIFCAGCHEQNQAVLVPGQSADPARWPDGTLPIHSTYSEWLAGPHADQTPCQACHMPPDAEAGNSSDIDIIGASSPGRAAGWWRPPGATRQHVWTGPRDPEVDMLALALTLDLELLDEGGTVRAVTRVRHTGPGHAVPTGEPMRSLVLSVEARCEQEPLPLTGPAIPAFAGAIAERSDSEDWSDWPTAQVGDVIRVVREEGWVDYTGHGAFQDRFTAEQKGLRETVTVGSSTVTGLEPLTLSRPLPDGDRAYLGRPRASAVQPLAGAPGFAFARVLTDAEGRMMVPHHRAVDVRIDNRLLPASEWTTTHVLDACDDPSVTATLTYRAYPWRLAEERSWLNPERVVAEVSR